jgi:hypothetical protein
VKFGGVSSSLTPRFAPVAEDEVAEDEINDRDLEEFATEHFDGANYAKNFFEQRPASEVQLHTV